MTKFVNKYAYTPQIAREAMTVWWRTKNRIRYIILILMVVGFPAAALIVGQPIIALIGLLGIFGIISLEMQRVAAARKELDNIRKAYHIDSPMMRVEIDETAIRTRVSNTRNEVSVDSIENYVVRKDMIVLFLKGKLTLALRNEGYEKGNAEEMIRFLNDLGVNKKQ
uniref:YcxB-like protein domain-containing protein n=1 Tax=Eubacterium cellulosolvens (strain ATCC 43171 / JCM 9499 / 6) TaxID=633697 RepID=I5AVD7_EUBC6